MAIGVTLLFVCGCLLAVSGEVTEQSPGLRLRRPVWTSDNFTRQSLQHLSSQLMQVVNNYLYTPACVGTATGSCNSPGAAAPGNVLLHFIQKPSLFRTRAASRTCRLRVFKEVHPTISSFLETVEFTDDTEISSSDKLFQRFMTR